MRTEVSDEMKNYRCKRFKLTQLMYPIHCFSSDTMHTPMRITSCFISPLLGLICSGCALATAALGESGSIRIIYYAPAWGPDTNGDEVVYFLKQVTLETAAEEQDRIYLCSIKSDGTQRKEIAWLWKDANPPQSFEPSSTAVQMEVNAATRHAAIGVEWGDRGGVFIVGLDGKGLQKVFPKEWEKNRPTGASYPTWSPDGQWIAFEEKRTEKGYDHRQIVKCHPDGSGYAHLTERDEFKINIQPAWSPITNLIAFVHYPHHYPGGCFLWLMEANGTNKRDTGVLGKYPRWSPDGKLILQDSAKVVDPVSGKQLRRLVPDLPMWPKWGHDSFVCVGPGGLDITDILGKVTRKLLVNAAGRAKASTLDQERLRW